MILYRWQGSSTNFGDELNTILWPALLPGFFDDDPAIRFLGIGSVLDQRHPSDALKLVAGAGYGGYERKPRIDQNWIIHWVRGPRSAALLGLPSTLALGDPAALLPAALGLRVSGGQEIGFMPHFESMERGAWRQAAEQAGLTLIDPRTDPMTILQAIGRCKVLLSEAMHGVIVADALRLPWVAIRPRAHIHRAKWGDWADTMGVLPRFRDLPASTLSEWAGATSIGSSHTTRTWLGRHKSHLERLTPDSLVARAGQALRQAALADPQLSSDIALDRCRSRMLDAVHGITVNPMRGSATPAAARGSQIDADRTYTLTPIGRQHAGS